MSAAERQLEKLARILDVTRRMAATTDLDALLGTILDAARGVLGCERASIFLYDAATGELCSRVATGVRSIRFPVDRGIAGAAARERSVINVADAYADPRFNAEIDRQTGFRTRNLLTFPLESLSGELVGVLQALNKVGGPFDHDDEELARVLSAQAGVALHRWRLLEEYSEKQRMARDLEIARSIQQAQFPKEIPHFAEYEVAGWNRPADETGGDCYDFIPIDGGRLAVLLADATGHGIGPALVVAECRAVVRAMLSVTGDLGVVTARVNRLLAEDLQSERFVTAFLGVLDPARHCMDYVAAGQGPLLFVSPTGTEARSASSLPLAVMADMQYEVQRFDFTRGSTLVLLTDGFYETTNAAGEQFGRERISAYVSGHAHEALGAVIAGLHEATCAFRDGCAQSDDLTAILIRRRL